MLAEYFRKNGTDAIFQNKLESLVKQQKPITGNVGDVMVCHPQLPHLGYPTNLSSDIRYMVFFRVHRKAREFLNEKAMVELFTEWDGMKDFSIDDSLPN